MAISLQKGGNVNLSKEAPGLSKMVVGLGWDTRATDGAAFDLDGAVFLVKKGTLDEFVYLEHGAHYAIGILALIMLASMKFHIPEIFTGLIGVAFIVASLWSSVRHRKEQQLLAA